MSLSQHYTNRKSSFLSSFTHAPYPTWRDPPGVTGNLRRWQVESYASGYLARSQSAVRGLASYARPRSQQSSAMLRSPSNSVKSSGGRRSQRIAM